jgi:hypothetical protein
MADSSVSPMTVTIATQNPLAERFQVPIDKCEVVEKDGLVRYRQKWLQWMSWYQHSDSEPHSIESQIHRMFFNDLTYRAAVSVREAAGTDVSISARSPTLAFLLDQGYVVSQVLAIQKLLDAKNGVISVRRLLKDVEKQRSLITREVYVSGTGLPYEYDSWPATVSPEDPMIRRWGIEAPGLVKYAISKDLHEKFDILSGKQPQGRTRDDVIPKSVFSTLDSWISGPSAKQIKIIRDNFIAHSADAVRRNSAQFTGVRFSQIDELQRAIVRVERALVDHILSIRIARDVVPMPPLGLFKGLDLPYSLPEGTESMHRRWDELKADRDKWSQGVLQDITASSARARRDDAGHGGGLERAV